jgi:hypothetical protein
MKEPSGRIAGSPYWLKYKDLEAHIWMYVTDTSVCLIVIENGAVIDVLTSEED